MNKTKHRSVTLKMNTLTAALLALYGVGVATNVSAAPGDNTNLLCRGEVCSIGGISTPYPPPSQNYEVVTPSGQTWAVKGEGAEFGLTGLGELDHIEISSTGNSARGVGATLGSKITIDYATVSTNGNSGHAIQSFDTDSVLTINNSDVNANGTGYSVGVLAQNGGKVEGNETDVTTLGAGASGIEVDRGGVVEWNGGSITTNGSNAAGVRALSGSQGGDQAGTVTLNGTNVTTNGTNATALLAGDKDGSSPLTAGHIIAENATITTNGANAKAAWVRGGSSLSLTDSEVLSVQGPGIITEGSGSTTTLVDTDVRTQDEGPASHSMVFALQSLDGAEVTINGGSVRSEGAQFTRSVYADTGGTVTATDTEISTEGKNSHAVHALGNSNGDGTRITLTGGSVQTQGDESSGVYARNGGILSTDGTSITTDGAAGFGAYALNSADISLANGSILTTGGPLDPGVRNIGSHGVLAQSESTVVLNTMEIETRGDFAGGLYVESSDSAASATLVDGSTVNIQTAGAQAHGASAIGSNSDIRLVSSTISTAGVGAIGAQAQGGGSLTLAGSSVSSTQSTGLVIDGDGTSATLDDTHVSSQGRGASNGSLVSTVRASNKASATINGGSITSGGDQFTRGVLASTGATVHTDGTQISTAGKNSHAVHAFGQVGDGTRVELTAGSISTQGAESSGVYAQNGGSILTDGTAIATEGAAGFGAFAYNSGDINLQNGSIQTEGGPLDPSGRNVGSHGVLSKRNSSVVMTNMQVDTTGDFAEGLIAESEGEPTSMTGIVGNGVVVHTQGTQAHGASAMGPQTSIRLDSSMLNTAGVGATGARAQAGGLLALTNSDVISAQGSGMVVDGEGSSATLSNTTVRTLGQGAGNGSLVSAVRASDGAIVTIEGGSILSEGEQFTRSILASTGATVNAQGVEISTAGKNSHAVHAFGQGDGNTRVSVVNGSIDTNGDESSALYAQNGGNVSASDTAISTRGSAGFGAFAYNGGTLNLANSSIETDGSPLNPEGRNVGSHGVLSKKDSTVMLETVQITTHGDAAEGVIAESEGEPSATTLVTGLGVNVQTYGGQAHGGSAVGPDTLVHLTGGAINTAGARAVGIRAMADGQVVLDGVAVATEQGHGVVVDGESSIGTVKGGSVRTNGAGASGLYAINGGEIELQGGSVETHGAQAHGVSVIGQGSDVEINGGSVLTTGAGSSALHLEGSSQVAVNGATLDSAGATISSSLDGAGQTQNVTLGSGTEVLKNNGVLLQVDRTQQAMDGIVNLTLEAGSTSVGDIVDLVGLVDGKRAAGGTTNFVLDAAAKWHGSVRGVSDIKIAEGGTFTADQDSTIAGNLVGAEGSSITFEQNATIGGAVNITASQLLFNGQTSIGFGDTLGGTFGGLLAQNHSIVTFNGPAAIAGDLVLTGESELRGGTSANPVQIGGDVRVVQSWLGGNLVALGQLTASNSHFAPGNSIGQQTFGSAGEITASTYHVEVNGAGQSDKIIISNGDIDVSGIALTVGQEDGTNGYRLNHDYSILETSNGKVVNDFSSAGVDASLANTIAKLDPVKYGDRSNVMVSLSVDESKLSTSRSSLTANQNATLDGVVSVAGNNSAADAAVLSTDLGGALNQLSGEVHASTQSALLNSSNLIVRTLSNTMRANAGAGTTTGSVTRSAAHPLWAQVVGNWNHLDGDSNVAKVKQDTAGIFVGGDVGVGQGWRVGAALGYTDGRIKVDGRDSKSDVSSYTAALYGANSWATQSGHVNFLLGGAYTRHDIDTRRQVTLGGAQTLKADYKANSTQLFTELGYAMPVGASSVVEPYLGVAWTNQRTKSFTESGGAAALSGDSQTDDVTTVTLGLRGQTSIEVGTSAATLSAGAGWRHASGDVNASRRMALVEGNGAAFKVAGAPIAKNAAVLDLGAEVQVGKDAALGVSYSGQFGNGTSDNAGSLYLRVRFD
jgi:outer membrane autotransporter protein